MTNPVAASENTDLMNSEMTIAEEYKVWRKNVPYIYDMVYTQALKWPTPCIQWFPDAQRQDNKITSQRLLLTTFTAGSDKEHLLIAQIGFPDLVDEDSLNNADISFKFNQSLPLSVDVNRARYSPLATNIIACRSEGSDVLIYDYTKHSSTNSDRSPDLVLKGHTDGGFALDWNPQRFGELVTGGRDMLVNIFDINRGLVSSHTKHTDIVNDLSFSSFDPFLFCSVSDDLRIIINDSRSQDGNLVIEKGHTSSIECCGFSPFKSELISTGSSDTSVKIWDIRCSDSPLFTLRGHKNTVLTTRWSPHYESILGTSSSDRRVIIWDLNKSNEEETGEILFVHGGHTESVDDFDWNPAEPMEIASVSGDGLLHVWKIPLEEYI